jgi:putative transposase
MKQGNSLNHTRWECKYLIVFNPKYRRKATFGQIRRELADVFHSLVRQKDSLVEEGHLMPDHLHRTLVGQRITVVEVAS